MKKLKIVFISVAAAVTAIAVAQFAFKADQKPAVVLADAPQPQFVEQGNALDLAPSATYGTAEFAVDNYAVQDGDYLAIDIEGYNGDNIFKIGLNGTIVASGADGVTFNHQTYEPSGWRAMTQYGYWHFVSDGRGIYYFPIKDYFPSITQISSFNFQNSDNRATQPMTFHNIFVTQSTTAQSGTNILDCFTAEGELDNTKVTLSNVAVTARKSAKGFQSNQTLGGGIVITQPHTKVELALPGTVTGEGGYFAYDVSFNGSWMYFQTSYKNTADDPFSGNYYATGKSLSKNGTVTFNELGSQYGWYHSESAISGTVLERVYNVAGQLAKIVVECDNLSDGSKLILSNFYYISKDQKTVTPLINLAGMSDEEFATTATVTISGAAGTVGRVDPVQDWIDHYLFLGDPSFDGEGTGLCQSNNYYINAKIALAAVEGVRSGSIAKFQANEGGAYTAALARYSAWASACGDLTPFDGKTIIA